MADKANEMMKNMDSMMAEVQKIRLPPAAPPGIGEGDEIGGTGFEWYDEYAQLNGDAILGDVRVFLISNVERDQW